MNLSSMVNEFFPAMVAIRRQLHSHPELGLKEHKTADLIARNLTGLGLEVKTGLAGTGVTGLLRGQSDRTIAIRADMDALPVQEQNDAPYASTLPGVMHACGHDGHVATVLGAAMVLNKLRATLPGTVKFIFQPAEEGPGGAKPMIEQGVLKDPEVSAVLGLHLNNTLRLGQIGLSYGQTCAAADEIRIIISGKGGHGAYPHQTVDAIVVAAQVINTLQVIASRQTDPLESVVLSIGAIAGGYANNVIADKVELRGTVRTLSAKIRSELPAKIEQLIAGVAAAHGANYEFNYLPGYPPLVTDEKMTALVEQSAARIVGCENVIRMKPTMGGEDFAYFAQAAPSSFFRLGSGSEAFKYPGHHPKFDFAEQAMAIGAQVLVQAVLDYFSPSQS